MRYAAKVAKAYAESHPDRTRNVYQITWEPDRNWDNWDGDDASLVRVHELAYKAIHQSDPRAEVIGPAISPMWAIAGDYGRFGSEARGFLNAGGASFVDGFAVHPYFDEAAGARKHAWLGITRINWPLQYRARMNKFLTMWYLAKGTNARFYGTEVGLVLLNEENWSGPDLLHQARFDVIQFLEFLGLGAELNFGFYDVDWDIGKNTFEKGQHRGYYYNLDKVGWGARIMSPKPVAPAYAACSWFLEGHASRGPIAGLLGESFGYVFQRGADTVLAAWDSAQTHEVALDVSAHQDRDGRDLRLDGQLGPIQGGIRRTSQGHARSLAHLRQERNRHPRDRAHPMKRLVAKLGPRKEYLSAAPCPRRGEGRVRGVKIRQLFRSRSLSLALHRRAH